MNESNMVNNLNLVIMAIEGVLFILFAAWYVWSIAHKVSLAVAGSRWLDCCLCDQSTESMLVNVWERIMIDWCKTLLSNYACRSLNSGTTCTG